MIFRIIKPWKKGQKNLKLNYQQKITYIIYELNEKCNTFLKISLSGNELPQRKFRLRHFILLYKRGKLSFNAAEGNTFNELTLYERIRDENRQQSDDRDRHTYGN